LLYAPPLQRGRCQVIEDLPELRNIPVVLQVQEKIKRAYMIPGKKRLSFSRSGASVRAVVPAFASHCAVVFEYEP
jgi:hypothetical protein